MARPRGPLVPRWLIVQHPHFPALRESATWERWENVLPLVLELHATFSLHYRGRLIKAGVGSPNRWGIIALPPVTQQMNAGRREPSVKPLQPRGRKKRGLCVRRAAVPITNVWEERGSATRMGPAKFRAKVFVTGPCLCRHARLPGRVGRTTQASVPCHRQPSTAHRFMP